MTEQEYNDIKKRYEDYSQLKYKAQKLNVIRREIESLGLYQITLGQGDIKYDLSFLGDEKTLIDSYLKALIDVEISKIKRYMEEI